MRLLGIIRKPENHKIIDEMNDQFLFFVNRNFSNLYLYEILSAFDKAICGELLDHKGNRFEIFPRLDNIVTGKILSRWKEQKNNNQPYHLAKSKLLIDNKLKQDDAEIIELNDKNYFNEIISALYSGAEPRYIGAEFLYNDLVNEYIYPISKELPLEEQKLLKSKYIQEQNILYKREEKIFYSKRKKGILENLRKIERDESDKTIIRSYCRSIKVCEYLKEKYINTIMNNFVENLAQPFAHLIATGNINVLNKAFPTDFRGVIKIRANDIIRTDGLTEIQFNSLPELLQRRIQNKNFIVNAIIGEVEIVDCVIGADSIWAVKGNKETNIYNWILSNAKLYDEPIDDMKGDFSYWEIKPKSIKK